jgi:outer membrane protein
LRCRLLFWEAKKTMKQPLVPFLMLALSFRAWSQTPAPSNAEELSLDQAIAWAQQHNRLISNGELEVRKSDETVAAIRTYRLPALKLDLLEPQLFTPLNFRFPQGVFGIFPGIGPVPPANTSITTSQHPFTLVMASAIQPLTKLHEIGLKIRAQQLASEMNREKLRERRQAVSNQVKKLYFAILQTQSGMEAVHQAVELYTELDRLTERDLEQQVVLRSDSLEVKARLARAQYESAMLVDAVATQKEQLNALLGRDVGTEFTVRALPDTGDASADLRAARARALDQRPEVREARLMVRQAEYGRAIKKSEYIPDVSVGFNYIGTAGLQVLPNNVAFAGLLVNWDVFDWGRKKHELAVGSDTIEQARNALREAESQVLVEVDSNFRKLTEARALLRVVELAQQASEEKVRIAMRRYTQQATLLKDVLEAQTTRADAGDQYQRTLMSYWTAKADLDKAVGDD